jgi:SRSO17 transposase
VAYQLYLPQDWADDRERRHKAGVPDEVGFKTKPQIALEQLRWAHQAGLPRGVALLDAGYGNNTALRGWHHGTRDALRGRHLRDHNGVGTRHCAVAGEEAAVRAGPAGNTAHQ